MRISKLVLFLFIGLVVFAIVAVVALLFVDPTVFRGQIEARASAAFGRQFQIDGPISLERPLRPRIVIEDISIGNPAWASGEHFTKVEKIGVQVALFPLLRGDLTVDRSIPGIGCSNPNSRAFPLEYQRSNLFLVGSSRDERQSENGFAPRPIGAILDRHRSAVGFGNLAAQKETDA